MRESFERLLVGHTLADRYEVGERTGAGGMSVVYRAVDRRLGRPVAVKVVSLGARSPEEREELRGRFRREAASAARIPHHPNVVQVYDYGTDPELDLDFLVMELLEGRDLKEALGAGPMPVPEALRILREAARGLAAGHRVGIVHRDVKPANLFLTDEGGGRESVRVLDFGIAKPMEALPEQDLTRTGQLPHSPAYAAPEQMDRHLPLTPSSDVYQLGLIGYEMLSGERPFTPDERVLIRAGDPVPLEARGRWASVPALVRQVIERALRPAPDERFPDAAAFAEALSGAMDASQPAPPAAAAPVVVDEDHTRTVYAPAPAPPVVVESAPVVVEPAPPRAEVPPPAPVVEGVPVGAAAASTPARRRNPVLWAAPLLLLVVLGLWALTRGGGEDAPAAVAAGAEPPDSAALASLDDEFLRLQGAVAQRTPGGGAPAATGSGAGGAAAPGVATPPPEGAVAPPTDVLAAASAEITTAVRDLNQAWVDGEMSRHVAHYGSRVDYYNSRRLPRAGVRRDRTRDLRRYEQRQITLHGVRVQFLEPDRARVLADKEWRFQGDGGIRQGRGVQEYVFKRDEDDGKWYVVSEQLLSQTENRARSEE